MIPHPLRSYLVSSRDQPRISYAESDLVSNQVITQPLNTVNLLNSQIYQNSV